MENMGQIKVLLVQKMAGISGSERYFLAILPELRRRGVDARFLLIQHPSNSRKNDKFIAELRASGVPVDVMNNRFALSPWLIGRLAAYIRRHEFQLLQTNLIHADVWGACVKRCLMPRLRLLSVKHGYFESYMTRHGLDPAYLRTDLMSLLTRWSAAHADGVIAISSALRSFLVKGRLVEDAKTTTIPHGFDFSRVSSEVGPDQLRFGTPQILVPGRVVPVKQHRLLVRILPQLVRDFPAISIVIVGDGPLVAELQREVGGLGLTERVRWEGFRENMHDYIRDSDLILVLSAAEGFGLVVLEAWHHRKPVIAFDVPAINEIIESGVDGELIAPFDTDQLLAKLQVLLRDPARMQALGDAGKRKQIESYGLSAMCERTIGVYRRLIRDP
jgi:glycosyltransferase involved in cell wall biosynthesis